MELILYQVLVFFEVHRLIYLFTKRTPALNKFGVHQILFILNSMFTYYFSNAVSLNKIWFQHSNALYMFTEIIGINVLSCDYMLICEKDLRAGILTYWYYTYYGRLMWVTDGLCYLSCLLIFFLNNTKALLGFLFSLGFYWRKILYFRMLCRSGPFGVMHTVGNYQPFYVRLDNARCAPDGGGVYIILIWNSDYSVCMLTLLWIVFVIIWELG